MTHHYVSLDQVVGNLVVVRPIAPPARWHSIASLIHQILGPCDNRRMSV